MVHDFLTNNEHRTHTFAAADLGRLGGESYLTSRVFAEGLRRAIRISRPTAPGSWIINRALTSHIPDEALYGL